MKTKVYTKRAMEFLSVRVPRSDVELLRAAAAREEISQSEFLRQALRDRARRVLIRNQKWVQS